MDNTSLALIQQNPEKYTMLIPIETVSSVPEIMAPTIKAVKISTDLNDKEIYEQEKASSKWKDQSGRWHDAKPARYAITKKGLTKLAEAAGIKQVDSESILPSICQKCVSVNQHHSKTIQCGCCQSNKDIRYKVTISVPQLTGETLYFVDHHEINIEDAVVGMTEPQKREFLKYRAQMCEAKALNGAIRTALQIKGSYLIEEFEKPFVVGYLVPNLDHEDVKRVAIESMFQSRMNLFGKQTSNNLQAPMIECQQQHPNHDYGDVWEADIPTTIPQQQDKTKEEPITREQDFCCDKCNTSIPEKVWDYSVEHFDRPLCFKCQKIVRNERRGGV